MHRLPFHLEGTKLLTGAHCTQKRACIDHGVVIMGHHWNHQCTCKEYKFQWQLHTIVTWCRQKLLGHFAGRLQAKLKWALPMFRSIASPSSCKNELMRNPRTSWRMATHMPPLEIFHIVFAAFGLSTLGPGSVTFALQVSNESLLFSLIGTAFGET